MNRLLDWLEGLLFSKHEPTRIVARTTALLLGICVVYGGIFLAIYLTIGRYL